VCRVKIKQQRFQLFQCARFVWHEPARLQARVDSAISYIIYMNNNEITLIAIDRPKCVTGAVYCTTRKPKI
jgi:hypothetical protein